VAGQPEQSQLPPDADRARTELPPELVVDVPDVLQRQERAVLCGVEADLDAAHLPAELPGGGERPRRVAALDEPAGVALHLVAAAHAQVAGDRREPAGDPLDVRAGVPHVVDGGVVGPHDRHDAGLPRLQRACADLAADRADVLLDVDHGSPPRGQRAGA
jgi:hypothetical protein